jgi:glycosyltransferase involved in cell wall biosynthesis
VRVVHLITGLDVGGAEGMLVRLVATMSASQVENTVLSLASGGPLAGRIAARGIRVVELGMRPGRFNAAAMVRLFRALRRLRPDVLQTWLYHADLIGLLVGPMARVPVIVWNIRCAELDLRDHPRSLRLLLRALSWTSGWPAAIVSNSEAGRRAHEKLGYRSSKWVIIPNGFDTETYKPSQAAREAFRRELGIAETILLAGLIARVHPMKDHATFLQAAAIAAKKQDMRFVLVGRGVPESVEINDLVGSLGLTERVYLLGERADVSSVMPALDVAVSSSYSEAFPNVVGEAMACAVPAVVTDVGDSARIVGGTGRIVPPKNAAALAEAMVEVLSMEPGERRVLGLAARQRIIEEYSLRTAAEQYQQLYLDLSGRGVSQNAVCAG